MNREFSWIGTILIRTGGPRRVLHILSWIAVLTVIVGGLLTGQSFVAAVSPVSLALAYLLIRSGGKSRFRTDLPVQISLILRPDEICVFYPSLDRNDKKGERTEKYVFPVYELKQARFYQTSQTLVIDGAGNESVSFSDPRFGPREMRTGRLTLSLDGCGQLNTLLAALDELTSGKLVYC